MPDSLQLPSFSRCVSDAWSLRKRLDALTVSVNTLSGILINLECGAESRSASDIYKRIANEAFATGKDEFDVIGHGTIRSKLKNLSDTFSLIHAFEETRPPSKGRGGRMTPTEVEVFEKDARGYWFGDPLAAQVLATCATLGLSPTDIFTSAEQKGQTRAPATTALILYVLDPDAILSEKELIVECFWEPAGREQYNQLRTRVNKNLRRLNEIGLLVKDSHQEAVISHTGQELETYPRMPDGSRIVSETECILSYLEDAGEMRRQTLTEDVQTHHAQRILSHLRAEGVVEWVRGGIDDRTRITLTETGSTVKERVIEPLFEAIAPDRSLTCETRIEYERTWNATPTVEETYLEGAYRDQLRAYRDNPATYQKDVTAVNRIDQKQNPWR